MELLDRFLLDRNHSVLVVIDIQEKLCAAMDQGVLDSLVNNVSLLVEGAREMGVPVIVTEQYPKGLGLTVSPLREAVGAGAIEKLCFSCCGAEEFLSTLQKHKRHQVIVTGMEAHICVLQTVLELQNGGYAVHLVRDGVMSRKKENWQIGVEMARNAGAVITSTEAALFQLLRRSGTDEFKKLSKLVK
jgi:nicotinamidase-related amidase